MREKWNTDCPNTLCLTSHQSSLLDLGQSEGGIRCRKIIGDDRNVAYRKEQLDTYNGTSRLIKTYEEMHNVPFSCNVSLICSVAFLEGTQNTININSQRRWKKIL